MLTLHQFFGLIALVSGVAAIGGMIWVAVVPRDRYEENNQDEGNNWDDGGMGPETVRLSADPDTGEFARIPDEWDAPSLASLHDDTDIRFRCCSISTDCLCAPDCSCACLGCRCWQEPPTDERMERVVLALTESPEAWRARVEQDDHEWRARMQALLDTPIDFGHPLELAA